MYAYLLATASWLVCMLRQIPCYQATPNVSVPRFSAMCYTDLTALYLSRGQGTGAVPFSTMNWEYPVLTGYFAGIANWLADLFGAKIMPGIDGQQILDNAHIYFAVNAVLLFVCLLWLVHSQLIIDRPTLAIVVACSPTLMATGLINWDLLVVALTAAGLAAWQRDKYLMAGLWWGLGIAAKLYPVVIFGALFVWCLRKRKMAQWAQSLSVAVLAWIGANLPVMITHWDGWAYFYTFNSDRGADLGSIWYALSLARVGFTNAATWSRAFMVIGYLALAALIFFARKIPRVSQIAYLAVAIMVVGNLVYSPQYVLWILPLLVVANPRVVDLIVFTIAELFYFVTIWLFLGGPLNPAGQRPWVYIVSIVIRFGVSMWLMGRVALDVWRGAPPHVPWLNVGSGQGIAGSAPTVQDGAAKASVTVAAGSAGLPETQPRLEAHAKARVAIDSVAPAPAFASAQAGRVAVQGWLASRLLLLIVGLFVMWDHGWSLRQTFVHWDVEHFVNIATSGYSELTQTAFFPGLPLVMALFSLIGIPNAVTGTLLALAGSGFAAWALYRLAGGRVAGAVAVLAWSFAPMAIFGFVAYSEAPFCALAFWAWWFAREKRWGVAAGLAGAACMFRVTGVFLILALIALAFLLPRAVPRKPWERVHRLVWLAIPAAVVALYGLYLKITFGSWLTWFQAQAEGWSRAFHWPWEAWKTTWDVVFNQPEYGTQASIFAWEILAIVIGVAVTIWACLHKKRAQGVYVGAQVVAFSFQVWFISVARSMLTWFPAFLVLGPLASRPLTGLPQRFRQIGLASALVAETVLMLWWAHRFFTGAWAG
jgi:hypothetical protein